MVVVASIHGPGPIVGRGEGVPYPRYGESAHSVVEQLRSRVADVAAGGFDGLDRVVRSLPAGAARNALDCARLQLEARRTHRPVWERLELNPPRTVATAATLTLGSAAETDAQLTTFSGRSQLKVKLSRDIEADMRRLERIRVSHPQAQIWVDGNEGWTLQSLSRFAESLRGLGVELIEQPIPEADDLELRHYAGPIPLCADESCRGEPDAVDALADRYQAVNVKLDKSGGLSFAVETIKKARLHSLKVMIGSMVCTSLSIGPALLVAQAADWVDLDGAWFLDRDRVDRVRYAANGEIAANDWGLGG